MDRIQNELVDEVRAQPVPDWGRQDQLRQALEYNPFLYPENVGLADVEGDYNPFLSEEDVDVVDAVEYTPERDALAYDLEVPDDKFENPYAAVSDADFRGIFGDGGVDFASSFSA